MKKEMRIKNIGELFSSCDNTSDLRKKVNCLTIGYQDVVSQFASAVYFDALITVLVLSGKGTVCVNYRAYPVGVDDLLVLSSSHLFNFSDCTPDFRCLCLLVSKEFINEMDSTDMIYHRVKYGVRLYNSPIIKLVPENAVLLSQRIFAVNETIDRSDHFYYKEIVLNSLFTFYLDLSNIIERYAVSNGEGNLTRYESMIKSFIELLVAHYREEHKVEFYASRLNLSAHYLTLIVKRVTGQSVCDFIFEMLYSDARTLLTQSKLSVQEIAALLNFSDQSSFGKFFKRKSGLSPIDFRKIG
ncbi:MAG: AraC family transcriptional regulator [Odoribacter splanchnicus]|nr:AraC family transcriptional regulator [Odoribacter splanchnicus]